MFSNVRQGTQLWILHKSARPYVEVGIVESVSNIPMLGYYPSLPTFPIDITLRVGDKTTTYKQLPANAEVADVVEQTSGEQVTIACAKEAVTTEVQAMRQKSVEAINSVEYHKQRITLCDTLLQQLNPEQAEKEAQAAEVRAMRERMDAMQKQMQEQAEINRQLLAKLNAEGTSSAAKTKKEL